MARTVARALVAELSAVKESVRALRCWKCLESKVTLGRISDTVATKCWR